MLTKRLRRLSWKPPTRAKFRYYDLRVLSKDRDMKIRVKLYTILKKYGEGKIDQNDYMSLPEHETLHGLAAYLGIPERPGKVFLVNGSPRPKEYKLSDEDEVKILGFIGGG